MMHSQAPLLEHQRRQMLVALRPGDGWPVHLTHTAELEADYRAWLQTECTHEKTEMRRTVTKSGADYFGLRCVICDERMSDWFPKKQIPDPEDLPVADPDGPVAYERRRREGWRATQHRHLEIQGRQLSVEYQEYLKSPAWRAIRDKVLRRAKGRCEGCGDRAATQVHHLSYAHIYREFLWELAAVCDECHERVHDVPEAEE
jgi:hypothetical protein